jgi:hypothetical protein
LQRGRQTDQFNWDFSVLKNTRLGGDRSLQFRAEFFNFFNHAQFDNPNPNSIPYEPALPNVSAPYNFGQIVKTSVKRHPACAHVLSLWSPDGKLHVDVAQVAPLEPLHQLLSLNPTVSTSHWPGSSASLRPSR